MFCSNSYDFTDQSHFAFTGNENLISSSSSSRFLHFPDSAAHADQQDQPFLADYDDNDLFMNHFFSSQHQINDHLGSSLNVNNMASDHRHHQQEAEIKIASLDVNNRASSNKKKENAGGVKAQAPGVPRKRGAGKKDRHSKIFTAQGPRDRRMRLSLQIARKFFDLQDMLGFDKASKTIEWLFSKSKAAIKELTESLPLSVMNSCTSTGGGALSLSSTNSESEVASAIINNKSEEIGDQKSSALPPPAAVKRTKSRVKSTAANNPIARESRDKARARARERTVERMKMNMRSEIEEKLRKCCDLDQLQEANPNEEEENRMDSDDVSIIEKFLGITTSAPRSSPSIFDYTQSLESIVNNNQLQAQNPGEIFRINNLDTQEQESRSIYMGSSTSNAAREQNPNPAGPASQNPSSIFISTSTNIESQPQFQEHHFSCSPIVDQMDKSFSSIWKFR